MLHITTRARWGMGAVGPPPVAAACGRGCKHAALQVDCPSLTLDVLAPADKHSALAAAIAGGGVRGAAAGAAVGLGWAEHLTLAAHCREIGVGKLQKQMAGGQAAGQRCRQAELTRRPPVSQLPPAD
jgi:hypothetical protein